MSGITLKKTVAGSIPTPSADKITIFHNDATDAPAYKDDLGVTNPIGGGAPSGAAGGVLGGTYPNPSFAADMATQAELDAHTGDASDAHDASAVSIVDAGGYFTGTEAEAALQELGIAKPVFITAGSSSGNAGALAAATALDAAIAAMPSQGGKIQISRGYVTYTALPGPDLSGANIDITGLGSVTGGADAATIIEYTGTGSGTFITVTDATSPGLHDLEILYTNTGFTGKLVSTAASTGQTSSLNMENVILKGSTAVGQTATLLDLNKSIVGTFNRVFFNGGGIAVSGRRSVAVSGISIANPSVITAVAHGYATGQTVTFGAVATTPVIAVNPPTTEGYVITVTGADTFTIPVNITATTDVAGYATSTIDFCNVQTFRDCEWISQRIVPLRNPGESFVFINPTVQALANGDLGFIDHLPGCRAKGMTILGGGCYDQTTTAACTLITFAGDGITIVGFKGSGRQVSQVTFLKIDEGGCNAIFGAGNSFDNMYIGLDLGAVTGGSGQWGPNAYTNILAGYKAFNSTGVRDGIEIANSTYVAGRATVFTWDDNSITNTMLQFDGDTATRLYRLAAGVLFTTANLYSFADIRTAYSLAVSTRVYGNNTNAGIAAEGTNSNVDITITPKGTGRIVLTVRGAAAVPTGAPTGTELPIAYDTTAVTGGTYAWTGAAWVKISTI